MKESDLQRLVLDWLTARNILAFRMNVGTMKAGSRYVRFGVPGMADILAFDRVLSKPINSESHDMVIPTWIELKDSKNEQSDLQKSFQDQVQNNGHRYLLVRSLDELEKEMG